MPAALFTVVVVMLPVVGSVKSTVPPALRVMPPSATLRPVAPFCVAVTAEPPALRVVPLNAWLLVAPLLPVTLSVPPPNVSAWEARMLVVGASRPGEVKFQCAAVERRAAAVGIRAGESFRAGAVHHHRQNAAIPHFPQKGLAADNAGKGVVLARSRINGEDVGGTAIGGDELAGGIAGQTGEGLVGRIAVEDEPAIIESGSGRSWQAEC